MTFDPTSVDVTGVTLPKDHCVQVPWEYINVCGYSDEFCKLPHTYTHILRTYYVHTTYYILHTTYRISDHIVSLRRDKKLISKISVDFNFMFSSCAWLCVFHCSHRLLCWIKSRVWDFLWKLLSFHTEMILAKFLWGSELLRGGLRKYAKNYNF